MFLVAVEWFLFPENRAPWPVHYHIARRCMQVFGVLQTVQICPGQICPSELVLGIFCVHSRPRAFPCVAV